MASNSFQETRSSKQITEHLRNEIAVIKDYGSAIEVVIGYGRLTGSKNKNTLEWPQLEICIFRPLGVTSSESLENSLIIPVRDHSICSPKFF